MNWKTIHEVREANKAIGHHWFDAETIEFFKSKTESGILHGRFFISSEKDGDRRRLYSVRVVGERGNVYTLEGFQGYDTLLQAKKGLTEYLGENHDQV